MPENPVLETKKRTERGTRSAKRLRGQGLIPAVMYGPGVETELLAVDGEALYDAIEQRARMVELKIGSKKRPVIIKDVQFDHPGACPQARRRRVQAQRDPARGDR